MNSENTISFQVLTSKFIKTVSYTENGEKYLLFIFGNTSENGIFLADKENGNQPLLAVPDDNSTFTNQLKNLKEGENVRDNYTVSFQNLKFRPKFHNFYEGVENQQPEIRNGLLIKDTNQVQKSTNNQFLYPEFTFKFINQFKEGYGWGKDRKRLSYQESFSKSGDYEHILEIEPVNLEIENFPLITRLVFDFAKPLNSGGPKPLRETLLYCNSVFNESVEKTLTMKVKNYHFGGGTGDYGFDTLYFGSVNDLDWDGFLENSPNNPSSKYTTPQIIGRLIIICFIFLLIIGLLAVWKKRKKIIKE